MTKSLKMTSHRLPWIAKLFLIVFVFYSLPPVSQATQPAATESVYDENAAVSAKNTSAVAKDRTTADQVRAIVPQLENYVITHMQKWGTPGVAIGIIADDDLVYARGFGVLEKDSTQAVDENTVFQIGSTTKAFLGVTQALLVADGKLDWHNRVIDYYPNFRLADPWVTREFQIIDLLAQRSGLPYSTLTNMMLYGYAPEVIIAALRHIQPISSFRSKFAYQNAFHLLAAAIVAQQAGHENWTSYLKSALLQPLAMDNTTTAPAASTSKHASGHRFDGKETIIDPPTMFLESAGAAGNIYSTVHDLSRWLRFHINQGQLDGRQIIAADELATTYRPLVVLDGPIGEEVALGPDDQLGYATGWMTHQTPEGRLIEHGGATVGFTSHLGFDPDRRFGFVVLVNQSMEIGNGLAIPFGKTILDLLQGRQTKDHAQLAYEALSELQEAQKQHKTPPKNPLPSRPLSDYEGRYSSPVLGEIIVAQTAPEQLGFELGPHNIAVSLTHWSGDSFNASIPLPGAGEPRFRDQVRLSFMANDAGDIEKMIWAGDMDSSGQPAFTKQ
ncbi:MAG TPA: serine hydrolase [Burkholderiaceae bacterium]|nr:serine hydrolase [Burkholderiaceae bacterium]